MARMWELARFDEEFQDEDVEVLASVVDKDADYSFDDMTCLRFKKSMDVYVVSASGCSCPSHEETAVIAFGPVRAIVDVVKWVQDGNYPGYTYTQGEEEDFIQQLKKWDSLEEEVVNIRKEARDGDV